jgi:hypothetical protein
LLVFLFEKDKTKDKTCCGFYTKSTVLTSIMFAIFSLKDDLAGEVPVAFVVRSNGSQITEDDIKQFVSKQVTFFF